ncbi:hypothetical protein RUND412_003837 [Rhizina undulata]
MPSLIPLLSSGPSPSSPPPTPKKTPKKLRRRNPPPSLSTNHQRLPSADSSTVSLPKSRPASSKSSYSPDVGGWMPGTPHPNGGMLRRSVDDGSRSWGNGSDEWMNEYPLPPLPTGYGLDAETGNGVMTPPQSGSPGLCQRDQNPFADTTTSPQNVPSRQRSLGRKEKGKGKEQLRGFSYDLTVPASPPLMQPPYLGTAQYPNNMLLSQNNHNDAPSSYPRPGIVQSHTFPTTLNTNLAPPLLAQHLGRTPNGSPILPPLPSFQSGGFGFDLSTTNDGPSRKPGHVQQSSYPGRQSYKPAPASPPAPTKTSVVIPPRNPERKSRQATPPAAPTPAPAPLREERKEGEGAGKRVSIVHALTAEEPIPLSSTDTSAAPSPESPAAEFAPAKSTKASENKGSFLGGWKLVLESRRPEDSARIVAEKEAPVGVGEGGGWIHKRKGSFSSTRPPSAEKGKHKAFGMEYREFRELKAKEKAKRDETERKKGGEKAKRDEMEKVKGGDEGLVEEPMGQIEPEELVRLDVAVRQMALLEQNLKNGTQPISPPDSLNGDHEVEKEPKDSLDWEREPEKEKGYLADESRESTESQKSLPSSSASSATNINPPAQKQPAPPPGHKAHKKTKSLSPLRNEVNPSSPTPPLDPSHPSQKPAKMGIASAPTVGSASSSSRYSANSQVTPPSEYLGRSPRTSTGTVLSGARPPTPPKPIAKLFVICCRCKYWHDLPSIMYRGMVENGGATRCPYCLHGMEVSCCSG